MNRCFVETTTDGKIHVAVFDDDVTAAIENYIIEPPDSSPPITIPEFDD